MPSLSHGLQNRRGSEECGKLDDYQLRCASFLSRRTPGVPAMAPSKAAGSATFLRAARQGSIQHKPCAILALADPPLAGMAELADAADSKSAGPCGHGGSTPPPGTKKTIAYLQPYSFIAVRHYAEFMAFAIFVVACFS